MNKRQIKKYLKKKYYFNMPKLCVMKRHLARQARLLSKAINRIQYYNMWEEKQNENK